jgi:hypothetical protein
MITNKETNFYLTGLFLIPNSQPKTSKEFFSDIDENFKKLLKKVRFFEKTQKHIIYVFCVFYDEWEGKEPEDLTDLVDFFDKPSIEITLYFDNASELPSLTENEFKALILQRLFPKMSAVLNYFNIDEKPLANLFEDYKQRLKN